MNPPFVSSCQTLRNEFDLFRPQTVSLRSTLKISMAIIQRGGGDNKSQKYARSVVFGEPTEER